MTTEAAEIAVRVGDILRAHEDMEGPLLPILHAIQASYGHVPQGAIPVIASGLNISRAEVHGVISFYHDFREVPAGRHVLKLCRAEAVRRWAPTAWRTMPRRDWGWTGTGPPPTAR